MPSKVKHTLAEAMTLMQVEKGVKALEKTIRRLVRHGWTKERKWYRTQDGHFSRDPVFDEIVKLGRTYRKSLRPHRFPDSESERENSSSRREVAKGLTAIRS